MVRNREERVGQAANHAGETFLTGVMVGGGADRRQTAPKATIASATLRNPAMLAPLR